MLVTKKKNKQTNRNKVLDQWQKGKRKNESKVALVFCYENFMSWKWIVYFLLWKFCFAKWLTTAIMGFVARQKIACNYDGGITKCCSQFPRWNLIKQKSRDNYRFQICPVNYLHLQGLLYVLMCKYSMACRQGYNWFKTWVPLKIKLTLHGSTNYYWYCQSK